ncbi:hypothetical protein LCGC14_0427000 [marine sediment metagenome]|uniref:Tubulin/FtsZ GTPase domain-containing protein n=1 Tax=marine sediment metagenome TaxID=412755 RepID=A0A0F9VYM2_9ZZZZ
MSVKTEEVEQTQEKIVDDLAEHVVVSEPVTPAVDADKLAFLKAQMVAKQVKVEEPKMPPRIIEKKRRTLNLGIVGSGQAGSRLAESFHGLGYGTVVINTAIQDLENINVPEINKVLLNYGLGGASKDPQIGHEAAQMHKDLIRVRIRDLLPDAQVYVFCTSLGGGSGGGSIETIVDVLSDLGAETGIPLVVITVLPMTNEDAQTKKNSLEALSKLSKEVRAGRVHNLIVVDNAKIETIFSDVGPMEFYKVSNQAIVDPLDVFNTYSSIPSNVKSLDPMEFTKILISGGGLSLYGSMTVSNYQDDVALADAVINNLTSGLLAEGFDLKQTQYCGVMFLANKKVWSEMPSSSIHYAMAMVQDHAGTPQGTFRGIYEADIKEDVVKVYSFFSGLALPDSRVEELKAEVAAQLVTIKEKTEKRNLNLSIDTGTTTAVSEADNVRTIIKDKHSIFGRFKKGVVDKRK